MEWARRRTMEAVLHESITSVSEPKRDSTPDPSRGSSRGCRRDARRCCDSGGGRARQDRKSAAVARSSHPGPRPDRHRATSSHSRARKPHGWSLDERQQKSNGQLANTGEDARHSRCPADGGLERRRCRYAGRLHGWRLAGDQCCGGVRVVAGIRFLRLRWRYSAYRPSRQRREG